MVLIVAIKPGDQGAGIHENGTAKAGAPHTRGSRSR
jgi:hypothetical protein